MKHPRPLSLRLTTAFATLFAAALPGLAAAETPLVATGADADTAFGVNVATQSFVGTAPSGITGIGGLGGLAGGVGLGVLGGLSGESPSLTATAERRLAPAHWLGLTLAVSYADQSASSAANSSSSAAEVQSASLSAAAAVSWRMVWNPGSRVEVGPFAMLGYRRVASDATTQLLDADGKVDATSESSARSQNVAISGGLNLDAQLSEHVGLRLAVQLAQAGWSTQSAVSTSDTAQTSPSESESTSVSGGLAIAPSLGLRVRF
ncbi:MAG: hypothetical protein H6747_13630 [Deltaproteobacteria bacterium]|nr:hypothetical protein [Deltaproteobacteria bacterium]